MKALYIGMTAVSLFTAGVYVGDARRQKLQAEADVAQVKSDGKVIDKIRADDKKQEVIYRDRIKIVRETVDDCLPRAIAGPVLEQLRGAGLTTAGPAPH